jgi:hypothetical protein
MQLHPPLVLSLSPSLLLSVESLSTAEETSLRPRAIDACNRLLSPSCLQVYACLPTQGVVQNSLSLSLSASLSLFSLSRELQARVARASQLPPARAGGNCVHAARKEWLALDGVCHRAPFCAGCARMGGSHSERRCTAQRPSFRGTTSQRSVTRGEDMRKDCRPQPQVRRPYRPSGSTALPALRLNGPTGPS